MRDSGIFPKARLHIDVPALRNAALSAMARARFIVQAVPIATDACLYTIAPEGSSPATGGFEREEAERYAEAINNEALLGRSMLLVLAELARLELETRRLSEARSA